MNLTGKTILYFGSFNPPHKGHVAVADEVLKHTGAGELWWVVSPCNPLKDSKDLAPEHERLAMAEIARQSARYQDQIRVCDVEFSLPKPSRTLPTLEALTEQYPDRSFLLLMGSDNVVGFDRWYRYEEILARFPVLVYPRSGFLRNQIPAEKEKLAGGMIWLEDLPLLPAAATLIREEIARGVDCSEQLPEGVGHYIKSKGLYGGGPIPKPLNSPQNTNEAALRSLCVAIEKHPTDATLYLQRGKLYHKAGMFDQALNDFMRVVKLDPSHSEADGYIKMLREIFAFRYTDLYNL